MSLDRLPDNKLAMTQELIANMLGVRREGVTEAAGKLQRLGVSKVDLAFRAVRDDIVRAEDGRLVARGEGGEMSVKDYLANFVTENPEFLPARIAGGTGMTGTQKSAPAGAGSVDLDKIGPSMSKEELEKVRQDILRVVTTQTPRGV